jgi:hypothetical protein
MPLLQRRVRRSEGCAAGHHRANLWGMWARLSYLAACGLCLLGCRESICSGPWCWQEPLPQGNDLEAVWSMARGEVWAVGDHGMFAVGGNRAWSRKEFPADDRLLALWVDARDDAWVVGERATYHWDGAAFTERGRGGGQLSLGASLRRCGDELFRVRWGELSRWREGAWVTEPDGPDGIGLGLWCTAEDDIWAGDSDGLVHWDGSAWSTHALGTPGNGWGIWGASRDDVWAATRGRLAHWDGNVWTQQADVAGQPLMNLFPVIWGTSASDIWLADLSLFHYDGARWEERPFGGGGQLINDIHGTAGDDVTFVGTGGLLLHWDGRALAGYPGGSSSGNLTDLCANSANDIWAVGEPWGEVLHFDGKSWAPVDVDQPQPTFATYQAVLCRGPNEVWVLGHKEQGKGSVVRFDGTTWVAENGLDENFAAAWAEDDVWAVGARGLCRWGGSSWESVTSGDLLAIDGSGPSDVWAVGNGGLAVHWNGSEVSTIPTPTTEPLVAVWARAPDDVWAVGGSNTVLHWLGGSWEVVPFDGKGWGPISVSGLAGGAVWVAGADGSIWKRSGSGWEHEFNGAGRGRLVTADERIWFLARGQILARQ